MRPTKKEWNYVIKLSRQLAFEEDEKKEKTYRKKYFSYMNELLHKYGDNADVLASLADFYKYDKAAIKLLKKAYFIARVFD